jgi:hypothetical protein
VTARHIDLLTRPAHFTTGGLQLHLASKLWARQNPSILPPVFLLLKLSQEGGGILCTFISLRHTIA